MHKIIWNIRIRICIIIDIGVHINLMFDKDQQIIVSFLIPEHLIVTLFISFKHIVHIN